MKSKKLIGFWLAMSLILGLSVLGEAQTGLGKGRLAGTIMDADGRTVAGARVLLTHVYGLKAETLSDAKGRWAIAGLGTGRVVLRILAKGYHSATVHVTVSQLSRNPRLPIVLEPSDDDALLQAGCAWARIVNTRID